MFLASGLQSCHDVLLREECLGTPSQSSLEFLTVPVPLGAAHQSRYVALRVQMSGSQLARMVWSECGGL